MAVVIIQIVNLPLILDPSPYPALTVVDSLLYIDRTGQNAPSATIKAGCRRQRLDMNRACGDNIRLRCGNAFLVFKSLYSSECLNG